MAKSGAFVLKSPGVNHEPSGVAAAALARAWSAIVRAFTPTNESRDSRNDGVDTTLFGGPDPPGSDRGRTAVKHEFWDPTGESTDFADPDLTSDKKRR